MCSSASSRRLYNLHNITVRQRCKHLMGQTCPSLLTDSIQSAEGADRRRLTRSVTLRLHLCLLYFPFFWLFNMRTSRIFMTP